MNRRSYLAGASGAAGFLAGCTDALRSGDAAVSPRDPPARPDDLTPESVTAYVEEYEAVRVRNARAERGAGEVTVRTAATFDHAAGDDRYATVRRAGTVSESDDGTRSMGELSGPPVPYLVTPDRTLRFDLERRTVDGDPEAAATDEGTGADAVSPPLGVRLLNPTDRDRGVSVTVTRRTGGGADGGSTDGDADDGPTDGGKGSDGGDAGTESVARSIESVPAASAVELRSVAGARGGYRVVARTTDDGPAAEGRIEVGLPSADRAANVDLVVDGDGVSAWLLPALEPL